jgi:rhamnosyltransferase
MVVLMKIALAIPTCNACGKCWNELLDSVDMQTLQPEWKLIVDSSSSDQTVPSALSRGWKCIPIRKEKFNHGGTRRKITKYLARRGFDLVIFMTQDVVLSSPDSLQKLVDYLESNFLAGCYGRQRSLHGKTYDRWQREHCYSGESFICSREDIPEDGLSAAFFSDAFAVWKIPVILKYGAFPDTEFGEDTLLAAKLLMNGEKTGYCAGAECIHEHEDSFSGLWTRGYQVGQMHRKNPWFLKTFKIVAGNKNPVKKKIPFSLYLPLAVKTAGYIFGRFLP